MSSGHVELEFWILWGQSGKEQRIASDMYEITDYVVSVKRRGSKKVEMEKESQV